MSYLVTFRGGRTAIEWAGNGPSLAKKSGIPADGLQQALLVSLRAYIIVDVASLPFK